MQMMLVIPLTSPLTPNTNVFSCANWSKVTGGFEKVLVFKIATKS